MTAILKSLLRRQQNQTAPPRHTRPTTQELASSVVGEVVGTSPSGVVNEVVIVALVAKVLGRIRPQKVAHGPEGRRLSKPIDLADVVERVNFR